MENSKSRVWKKIALFYTLTLCFSGVFDAFVLHAGKLDTGNLFTPLTRDTGPTNYIIDEFGMGLVVTTAIVAIVVWRRHCSSPSPTFR